jgi:aspartate ammonia-lyase
MPNPAGLDIVNRSIGLVTALNPIIGYKAATQVAKMALDTGRSVREIVLEEGLLDADWLDVILSPRRMTHAGIAGDVDEVPKRKDKSAT